MYERKSENCWNYNACMIQPIIQSKAMTIDRYRDSEADLHGPKEHAEERAEAYVGYWRVDLTSGCWLL